MRELVHPGNREGGAIKENQALVMRAFATNPGHYLLLMTDEESWNTRIDWILSDERRIKGSSSQLAYHVSCVRLLAACCAGNNPTLESQITSMLPLDSLIEVLLNIDVRRGTLQPESLRISTARWVKGAFVAVLKHAYMDSSRAEARAAVRRTTNRIWKLPPESVESTQHGAGGAQDFLMQVLMEDAKELLVALEYQSKGHAIEQVTAHAVRAAHSPFVYSDMPRRGSVMEGSAWKCNKADSAYKCVQATYFPKRWFSRSHPCACGRRS
jgi:hypothetical protein